jgi:hypothetical protein
MVQEDPAYGGFVRAPRIEWGDGEVSDFPLSVLPGTYQTFRRYAAAGTYPIAMTITDLTGLESNPATTSVTVQVASAVAVR